MDSITNNLPAVALVLAGLGLVAMLVMQTLQISSLRQRLNMLTRGADGASLEGVLDAHLELVHQVSEDLDEVTARTTTLEAASRHHLGRVGLVRFNPFPDTGGNQSFALAMLDESEDGFIVSSLHSRTGTRIYAKAIAAGKTDTTLSAEEAEAIDQARAARLTVGVPARPSRAPVAAETGASDSTEAAPARYSRPAARESAPTGRGRKAAAAPVVVVEEPADAPSIFSTGEPALDVAPEAPVEAPVAEAIAVPAPAAEIPLVSDDTAVRKSVVKGQSKGESLGVIEDVALDGERTGRRSARAGESGQPESR